MKKYIAIFLALFTFFVLPSTAFANTPYQQSSSYYNPADPIPDDGTSIGTISIDLRDSNSNPIISHVIELRAYNNTEVSFPQNRQTTDSNGHAIFTITSKTDGVKKISLYDENTLVVFPEWFTVTFYDATKGCYKVPNPPVITSVISTTENSATVTWENAANPVNNYLISYGIESGKYIYGNSNVGSQGTTSYTIKSLASNKKYFFVVAANNSCGTGGFSNEMSTFIKSILPNPSPTATISKTVSTPTPTPTDLPQIITNTQTPEPEQVAKNDTKQIYFILGLTTIGIEVVIILFLIVIQRLKNRNKTSS